MKRHWLLCSLALTAGALALSAVTLGNTWATAPPPSTPAGAEEPAPVPPIVRQTFEEDQKKVLEKARAERNAQEQKDIATIHERRKALEKAQAEASPAPPSTGTPPLAAVPAVASALSKQGLVPELVAILNETKSIDTFLVTLRLLEGLGPQAEPAIPAIIRNAERLELFKDHSTRKEGNSERIDAIVKSLETMRGQKSVHPSSGFAPLQSDAPTKDVPSQVLVRWNRTVTTAADPVHGGKHLPSLEGRVYFFGPAANVTREGDGTVTVELRTPADDKGMLKVIEKWIIQPEDFQRLKCQDMIGIGYRLRLPWGRYRGNLAAIQLTVSFQPKGSRTPLVTESGLLKLNPSASAWKAL